MDDYKERIQALRYEFSGNELDENRVDADPIIQFRHWFDEAVSAKVNDPNAFTLGTVGSDDYPDARIVLLKDFSPKGFTFYTNYNSSKGKELEANPKVCMNFFWPELARQVRVSGIVEKVSPEESDAYFRSRPKGSQISAWASAQSEFVKSHSEMVSRFEEMERRFENTEIPRPPHWGGYLIIPNKIEFWQGRMNRFHDRVLYVRSANGWTLSRLMP